MVNVKPWPASVGVGRVQDHVGRRVVGVGVHRVRHAVASSTSGTARRPSRPRTMRVGSRVGSRAPRRSVDAPGARRRSARRRRGARAPPPAPRRDRARGSRRRSRGAGGSGTSRLPASTTARQTARPHGDRRERVEQAGQQVVARRLGDQPVERDVALDRLASRTWRPPCASMSSSSAASVGSSIRTAASAVSSGSMVRRASQHLQQPRARSRAACTARRRRAARAGSSAAHVGAVALAGAQHAGVDERAHRLAQHVAGDVRGARRGRLRAAAARRPHLAA